MTEQDDAVKALTKAVDQLAKDARGLQSQLQSRTRALWAAVGAGGLVLVVVVLAAFTVSLGNRQAIEDNNRKFCPLVSLLVPQPGDPPRTTASGKLLSVRARTLADGFACDLPG